MTFDEFHKGWQPGDLNAAGVHSDWMPLATWTYTGSTVWLGDACFWSSEEDGLLIPLSPGEYGVDVRVADYGSEFRIAGLRAVEVGSSPAIGAELGETWADTATQGFCDAASYTSATEESAEDVSEAATELDAGAIQLPSGHTMFVVSCGFGDGEWPVYELLDGNRRVGFQVEFIEPGEEFPF